MRLSYGGSLPDSLLLKILNLEGLVVNSQVHFKIEAYTYAYWTGSVTDR
jgi:hypothetical protein